MMSTRGKESFRNHITNIASEIIASAFSFFSKTIASGHNFIHIHFAKYETRVFAKILQLLTFYQHDFGIK